LSLMARTGKTLHEHAETAMVVFPQVLQNVRLTAKMPDIAERLAVDIALVEARLGDQGRVLVRPSGTEPVIRVMVEAADMEQAQTACDELCAAVAKLS